MSPLARAASIDDLAIRARRRLPRLVYDFLDGGAGSEAGLARNRRALDEVVLKPRYFKDMRERCLATQIFGRTYAAPVGVAPFGLGDLIWPGAYLHLALMARDCNIPIIVSTAATAALEDIVAVAPEQVWFQLYVALDDRITFDLMRRADEAGIDVLVVTVDVPVPAARRRDIRNGFGLPLALNALNAVDFARRPSWLAATLRAGVPRFANLERYASAAKGAFSMAEIVAAMITSKLDLHMLKTDS